MDFSSKVSDGVVELNCPNASEISRSQEGPLWCSLPTELLQAALHYTDLNTCKAARLVCTAWRSAQARLHPSVPVYSIPPPVPHAGTSPRILDAHQSHDDEEGEPPHAGCKPSLSGGTVTVAFSNESAPIQLLRWLSRTFDGNLEQRGTVVLTVVGAPSILLNTALSNPAQRLARWRNGRRHGAPTAPALAPPLARATSRGTSECRTQGPAETRGSLGRDVSQPADQGDVVPGSCGGTRPLRAVLRHLATTGLRSLRVQHAAGLPTTGLPSAHASRSPPLTTVTDLPYGSPATGCASTQGSLLSSAVNRLWSASESRRVPPTPSPVPPLTHCEAPGCCHCCGCAAAPPPARQHVPVPGLWAVAGLRDLASLELHGVAFGAAFLHRVLCGMTQLTRLCVDLPIPANHATALSHLTQLRALHFTVQWPIPEEDAVGRLAGADLASAHGADAGAAAAAAAGSAGSASASKAAADSLEGVQTAAAAEDGSEKEAEEEEDKPGGDFSADPLARRLDEALQADHVLPCLTALSALPDLADLRIGVCHGGMARSLLSPPALLAAARRACPRLRRFAFRVLCEWQLAPQTLYNWVAADNTDHALRALRNDEAPPGDGVFNWQGLEWAWGDTDPPLQRPAAQSAPPSSSFTPRPAPHLSALVEDLPAALAEASGAAAAASGWASVADVAVSIRTSNSSWLGSCLDTASSLDAVAGSLSGCRLVGLALEDAQCLQLQPDPVLPGGPPGQLSLRALDAMAELRSLAVRDVTWTPRVRPTAQRVAAGLAPAGEEPPDNYLSQLLRLPSLTSICLQTTCPDWLHVLLSPGQPATTRLLALGPSTVGGRDRSPAPSGAAAGGPSRSQPGGLEVALPQLRRLELQVRGSNPAVDDDEEEEEEEEHGWGGEAGPSAGPGRLFGSGRARLLGAGAAPLSRLAVLSCLQSLHLDMPAILHLAWLPVGLQHLSLAHVTLLLEPLLPSSEPSAALAGRPGGPLAALLRPSGYPGQRTALALLRREAGQRRWATTKRRRMGTDAVDPPQPPQQQGQQQQPQQQPQLCQEQQAQGSQEARPANALMKIDSVRSPAAAAAATGGSGESAQGLQGDSAAASDAAAGATTTPADECQRVLPAPHLPNLLSLTSYQCALPALSALLPAVGGARLQSLALTRCRTLAPLPADAVPLELSTLVSQCGSSLRLLRVVRPAGGPLEAARWGAAGAEVRLLRQLLLGLPRLEALCFQVAAGQQEAVLGCLGALRELRELVLFHEVGPAGQQQLRSLTGLRCLIQLSPPDPRGGGGSAAARNEGGPEGGPAVELVLPDWMQRLAASMPLCIMKHLQAVP